MADSSITTLSEAVGESIAAQLSGNITVASTESALSDTASEGSESKGDEEASGNNSAGKDEKEKKGLGDSLFAITAISGAAQAAISGLNGFKVEADATTGQLSIWGAVLNGGIDSLSSLSSTVTSLAAGFATTQSLLSQFGIEVETSDVAGLLSGSGEAFDNISEQVSDGANQLGDYLEGFGNDKIKGLGGKLKKFSGTAGKAATAIGKFAGQAFIAFEAFKLVSNGLDFLAGKSDKLVDQYIEAGDVTKTVAQAQKNAALDSQTAIAGAFGAVGTLLGGPIVGGITAGLAKLGLTIANSLIPGFGWLTTATVDWGKELLQGIPIIGNFVGETSKITTARAANEASLKNYTITVDKITAAESERIQTAKLLGKSEAQINIEGLESGQIGSGKTAIEAKKTKENVVNTRVEDQAIAKAASRSGQSVDEFKRDLNSVDTGTRLEAAQQLSDSRKIIEEDLTPEDKENIKEASENKKTADAAFSADILNAFKAQAVAGGTTDIDQFVGTFSKELRGPATEALFSN